MPTSQSYNVRFTKMVACAMIVAVAAGCSRPSAPAAPQSQTVGGITTTLTVVPAPPNTGPPHSGDNTISLLITTSADGSPVDDANVTISAEMKAPRLAGQDVSGRSAGAGHYDAPIRLGIATRYDLHVRVQRRQKTPVDFVFPIEAAS